MRNNIVPFVKYIFLALSVFVASVAVAQTPQTDTVKVPSMKRTNSFSKITLDSCALYRIEARGHYEFDASSTAMGHDSADAQYCYDCYGSPLPYNLPAPNDPTGQIHPLHLRINEIPFQADNGPQFFPDIRAYQPTHVYIMTLAGNNKPLRAKIFDADTTPASTFYGDNRDTITLIITRRTKTFTLSRGAINFDSLACDSTTKTDSVFVRNAGIDTIIVTHNNGGLPGTFTVTPAFDSVFPGQSKKFLVKFTPPSNNYYTSNLVFFINTCKILDSLGMTVTLSGIRKRGPVITPHPDTLKFGWSGCNGKDLTLYLLNTGGTTLKVDSPLTATGAWFSADPLPKDVSVKPGDSIAVTVHFNPKKKGLFSGSLIISGKPCGPRDTIVLSGWKDSVGIKIIEKADSTFAPIACNGKDSAKVIHVRNAGDSTITISPSIGGSDPTAYAVSPSSATIARGDTATFFVTFAPSTNGTITAVIYFAGGCGAIDSMHVRGSKVGQATFTAKPAIIVFPTLRCPTDTLRDTLIIVKNTSPVAVSIIDTASLTDPKGWFTISPAVGSRVIAQNQYDTLRIRFEPKGVGRDTAFVLIHGEPCGLNSRHTLIGKRDSLAFTAIKDTSFVIPKCSEESSQTKMVTLKNTGTDTITISQQEKGAHFTVTPPLLKIPPGEVKKFTVTFTADTAKTYYGVIYYSGECSLRDSTRLTGIKNPTVHVMRAPESLDFDSVSCRTKEDSVVVKNTGYDSLVLKPAIVTGAGFTLVTPRASVTLQPGDSVFYKVRFDPSTSPGTYHGFLQVQDSLPCDRLTTLDFPLVGRGFNPNVTLSMPVMDIGVGERALVPIMFNEESSHEATALDLWCAYDSTMLYPYDVITEGGTVTKGRITMDASQPGVLHFTGDTVHIEGSGVLMYVDMMGTIGRATKSPFTVTSFSLSPAPCGTTLPHAGIITLTGCEANHFLVKGTVLSQNSPNPFSGSSEIIYEIQSSMNVDLTMYDVFGRPVKTFVHGFMPKGRQTILVNKKDFPKGMYFYQLRTPAEVIMKKMVVVE